VGTGAGGGTGGVRARAALSRGAPDARRAARSRLGVTGSWSRRGEAGAGRAHGGSQRRRRLAFAPKSKPREGRTATMTKMTARCGPRMTGTGCGVKTRDQGSECWCVRGSVGAPIARSTPEVFCKGTAAPATFDAPPPLASQPPIRARWHAPGRAPAAARAGRMRLVVDILARPGRTGGRPGLAGARNFQCLPLLSEDERSAAPFCSGLAAPRRLPGGGRSAAESLEIGASFVLESGRVGPRAAGGGRRARAHGVARRVASLVFPPPADVRVPGGGVLSTPLSLRGVRPPLPPGPPRETRGRATGTARVQCESRLRRGKGRGRGRVAPRRKAWKRRKTQVDSFFFAMRSMRVAGSFVAVERDLARARARALVRAFARGARGAACAGAAGAAAPHATHA